MVGLVLDPGVRFRDLHDRGQQHRIPWTTLSNRKARAFAPPAGSVRSKRIALPKHLIIGYDTPGSGAGRGNGAEYRHEPPVPVTGIYHVMKQALKRHRDTLGRRGCGERIGTPDHSQVALM